VDSDAARAEKLFGDTIKSLLRLGLRQFMGWAPHEGPG
jgi:hypothetical protein